MYIQQNSPPSSNILSPRHNKPRSRTLHIKTRHRPRQNLTRTLRPGSNIPHTLRTILPPKQLNHTPRANIILNEPQRATMPDIVPTSRGPVSRKCILRSCAVCVLEEEEFPGYRVIVAVLSGEVDCWDCCGACSEEAEEGEEGGGLHCLDTGMVWTDWGCGCSSGISCRAEQCLFFLLANVVL